MFLQKGNIIVSMGVDLIDAACYKTGCLDVKEHIWKNYTNDPIFLIRASVLSADSVVPAVPGIRGPYM